MTRISNRWLLGAVLLGGLLISPAVVAEEQLIDSGSKAATVLDDAVRMLNEGVGSPVIVEWLAKETRRVPALSPDDVIGLTRAGASEELVERLIEMSAHEGTSSAPPAAPAAAAVRPPEPSAAGTAGIAFSFSYRSQSDDGPELGNRWALFAYLDGELLTWSKSSGTFSLRTVNTSKQISPGPHVIRLVRESHKPRGKDRWEHQSLVEPTPIVFEVESGDGWHMSISWTQPAFSVKEQRPMSWRLTRWNVDVAGAEKTGTRKDDFDQLCEDAEASVPDGKKPNSTVKQQLKGCVHWSSLWVGVEDFPSRAELLEAFEKDDFRPPRD